ncbi:hypothetical protein JCM19297_2089 [Nonlabens ulvanivorans]|nr:hypothetical protein JCM19297_2089 [Nonlabens ulvanivorans]
MTNRKLISEYQKYDSVIASYGNCNSIFQQLLSYAICYSFLARGYYLKHAFAKA